MPDEKHLEIVCMKGGPNLIYGACKVTKYGEVVDADYAEGKLIALCACGKSANKPFCDGSHSKDD